MSTSATVGSRGSRRSLIVVRVGLVLCVVVALAGCSWFGVRIDVTGVDARWVEVPGPGDRRALVVTASDGPEKSSAEAKARPIVVVIHGLGQDAVEMATFGGWSEAARDHGLVVAYADGVEHSFNAGRCCGVAAATQVDDVGYLDRLVPAVAASVGADATNVHMLGFSNGGMMVYKYLCDGTVRLRGAASLAGTNVAGCSPQRPTPFLQVTGSADSVVPPDDAPSIRDDLGPLVSAADAVAAVADSFSCQRPRTTRLGPVTSTVWQPCADGVSVRYDLIDGLVHNYPIWEGYDGTVVMLQLWGIG